MSIELPYQNHREVGRLWRRNAIAPWARCVRTQILEQCFSNHVNALATRTTIKRNFFGPLFFFSCCVQFPSTSALEAILLGNPSHSKPVDDKWQMIGPLSPNHPAEVLKK
jgi:hypothetical protein